MDKFNEFIRNLTSGEIDEEYLNELQLDPSFLLQLIQTEKDATNLVKLPILMANASKGNFDGEKIHKLQAKFFGQIFT